MNITKKLTAEQILEIIKANYTEANFAYNEWTELKEEGNITIPPNLGEAEQKLKLEYHESIKSQLEGLNYLQKREHELYKTYLEMPDKYKVQVQYILDQLGLGRVEEVNQYGGEGQGDTWYSVKYFKDHDVYIRIDGFYSSYNGVYFNYGYGKEVRPQEKTITVYN